MIKHPIVSNEQWTEARTKLLAKEKEHTRQADEIARQRRELPWVRVEKNYVFDTPQRKVPLAELFRGKSQLIVYHFMFGPDWAEGCPSCSYVSDHLNAALPHLRARDTSLVMISRAPVEKIQAFKKRMGWQFPWVSSFSNSFNHDLGVYFTPEEKANGEVHYNYKMQPFPSDEAPGASIFYKDPASGEILHTYSVYSRGLDSMLSAYVLLDMVPKGRDEDDLSFDMAWVRHHDKYQSGELLDANKPYWPKTEEMAATSSCCHSSEAKR